MKLSIVIPMYNAGPYIEKCVRSCLRQSLGKDDYEIIIVDDGSTDGSYDSVSKLIDGLSPDTVSVRLFSQANSGPSVARNLGLSEAQGEYIWFVDADDWLEENCIGPMLEEVSGSDILAFGMNNFTVSDELDSTFKYKAEGKMSGPSFVLKTNEKLKLCAPLYLFRREFLRANDLKFHPGIFHEDVDFIPRAVYQAENVVVSDIIPYRRLIHPGSITQTVNPRRTLDLVFILGRLKEYRDGRAMEKASSKALNSLMSNIAHIACSLAEQTSKKDIDEFKTAISGYHWLKGVLLGSLQLKYRLEGFLLSLFPGHLYEIHHFLMKFKRVSR